ncbi:tRNA delta(2)-isopentenylpyrophosphate transferase [Synechococcus sp. PCC 7335]|nr:tRNA delta(2)-isopentenylpyrophosphate transferase [Synechococcus sp. PCC 7335]
MALASQWPAVILSADSRQVYREFDIGTAKPPLVDRRQVKHYFVDICEPTETLTVANYQQQARAVIASMHQAQKKIPLLVGGTGLYVNAIAKGLKIPRVAPHLELRSQLQSLGQLHCYQLLHQVDPEATSRIHLNDQVRTLRALEVFYISGRTISSQQGENPPDYPILYIGLACQPEALRLRIATRTHQMIEMGLVGEVSSLIEKYGVDLPLLKTLGYAEIVRYLARECSLDSATEAIIQHTCQFAKRQRTWFQKEKQIEWFPAEDPELIEKVSKRVEEFRRELCVDSA